MTGNALRMVWHDDVFLLNLTALQAAKALRRNSHTIFLAVAGIKHPQLSVLHGAAAGVTAILVMDIIRPQGQFRCAVMYEIPGCRMRPALVLMLTAQRIPLIENMELAIAKSQSIGVINQAKGHFQMEPVMPAVFQRKTSL